MSVETRVCFRIPENYDGILKLIQSVDGRIVDATTAPEDYEEFLAWHVDDIVDMQFISSDKTGADAALSEVFAEFERLSLPSAAATTSVYDTIADKAVNGILYRNATGLRDDVKARTTYATQCTKVPVRQAFHESGFSKEEIETQWEAMRLPELASSLSKVG